MAKLVYPVTYDIARTVVDMMQCLFQCNEERPLPQRPETDILVTPFTHGGTVGFHLRNAWMHRACNIVGSNVDQGIVIALGSCKEFDVLTLKAGSLTEMRGFGLHEVTDAARMAVDWLLHGQEMRCTA
jgi:hypothetical protein